MSENTKLDWVNLSLTILSCVIGAGIAILVSRSADDLNQSSLFVASAGYLLEKEPNKQCTGVEIIRVALSVARN